MGPRDLSAGIVKEGRGREVSLKKKRNMSAKSEWTNKKGTRLLSLTGTLYMRIYVHGSFRVKYTGVNEGTSA
jgi:hypothetical protein